MAPKSESFFCIKILVLWYTIFNIYHTFTQTNPHMKLKKIISIFAISICTWFLSFTYWQNDSTPNTKEETITELKFDDNLSFWDGTPVSWINLPRLDTEWFEWDEPIVLVKEIIYKVVEILPFVIFVMLLLWCFHMIVSIKDWEWKKWARIIKQVIVWTILFIISIYVLNIVSIYLTWYPVININRIIHPYVWTNYWL